jgi:hypothetical protein
MEDKEVHSGVLVGIARLSDLRFRKERHKLRINCYYSVVPQTHIDRRSLQHLVDFLDNVDSHEVVITELELFNVKTHL